MQPRKLISVTKNNMSSTEEIRDQNIKKFIDKFDFKINLKNDEGN